MRSGPRSRGLYKPESCEFPIVHVPGEAAAQAMSLYPVVLISTLPSQHTWAPCGTTALECVVVANTAGWRHSYFLRLAQT